MRYKDLSFNKKIAFLKRLHAKLNKELFAGELPAVGIDICNNHYTGPSFAMYASSSQGLVGPKIMFFYEHEDYVEKRKTQKEQAYVLTALMLHEMVHQYCHIKGIDDTGHGQSYMTAAQEHGLHSVYKDEEIIEEWLEFLPSLIADRTRIY